MAVQSYFYGEEFFSAGNIGKFAFGENNFRAKKFYHAGTEGTKFLPLGG